MRAATVKARVNTVYTGGNHEETKPIDGPISFPPINLNRVIVPHYDALVLTLCISGFDVHRMLVDPSSTGDLLQPRLQPDEALLTNVELSRTSPLWFQRHNNHDIGRHHTSYTNRASYPAGFVLSRPRLSALQLHSESDLAALDEGRLFNISSYSQLLDQCGAG